MSQNTTWENNQMLWPVEKIPIFRGTRRFITVFTTAHHLLLYWARSIYSMNPSYSLKIHLNIILQFPPRTSKRFPAFRFANQNPVRTSHLSHTCHMPRPSHSSSIDSQNIWRGVQINKISPIWNFHHSLTEKETGIQKQDDGPETTASLQGKHRDGYHWFSNVTK